LLERKKQKQKHYLLEKTKTLFGEKFLFKYFSFLPSFPLILRPLARLTEKKEEKIIVF
jgi:hypothetical protein